MSVSVGRWLVLTLIACAAMGCSRGSPTGREGGAPSGTGAASPTAEAASPGTSTAPPATISAPSAAGSATVAAGTAEPSPAQVGAAALSYEARLGQAIYRHYCQTCHGETGAGDGFNAFNLDPHPRDLSAPVLQKGKTDAELADAICRGGAGVGLSPLMPPWGHTLSPQQIDNVIFYLRSLRRSDPPS